MKTPNTPSDAALEIAARICGTDLPTASKSDALMRAITARARRHEKDASRFDGRKAAANDQPTNH